MTPSPAGEGGGEENKIRHLLFPLIQPSPSGEGFKTCVDTYALAGEGWVERQLKYAVFTHVTQQLNAFTLMKDNKERSIRTVARMEARNTG